MWPRYPVLFCWPHPRAKSHHEVWGQRSQGWDYQVRQSLCRVCEEVMSIPFIWTVVLVQKKFCYWNFILWYFLVCVKLWPLCILTESVSLILLWVILPFSDVDKSNQKRQWNKGCLLHCYRFYRTNHVKQFVLKRPFHKGKKDKENEYKVLLPCTLTQPDAKTTMWLYCSPLFVSIVFSHWMGQVEFWKDDHLSCVHGWPTAKRATIASVNVSLFYYPILIV